MKTKYKTTIQAGNFFEVYAYNRPTIADTPAQRAARVKFSMSAERKRINDRNKTNQLKLLMYCNFADTDLMLTLTYSPEYEPRNRAEARKRVRVFLKSLRVLRNKRGQELKYIYTTEGKHGEKKLHHHLLINRSGPQDLEDFITLWGYCAPNGVDIECIKAGDTAEREYEELAGYLVKEPKGVDERSFICSRNLSRPVITHEWINDNETIETPASARVLREYRDTNIWGSFVYAEYIAQPERESKTRRRHYQKR